VQDSVEFILQNFNEMVRLWVRMETKGIIRDKDKREKERKELRILVGFNLVRLSQLEGVDLVMYQQTVLGQILEIVIQCKDQIAQQYLMEIIIQVFPDEFHLATLKQYLESCMLLHQGADLRTIFTALMDRLAKFSATFMEGKVAKDKQIEEAIQGMVELLTRYINKAVVERSKMMTTAVFVQTQHSLLNLVLKAYPEDMSAVNQVITATCDHFNKNKDKRMDPQTVKLLKKFLIVPIDHYENVVTCLDLAAIPDLIAQLPYNARRGLAKDIASAAAKYSHKVDSVDQVNKLFTLLAPLIQDEQDQPTFEDIYADEADFAEEQNLVAKLVHLLHNDNPDILFKMYSVARKQFGTGGPNRIKYTLVPMVFSYLKLGMKIHNMKERGEEVNTSTTKVLQYVLDILQKIDKLIPEQVLRLYLQTGAVADHCQLEDQTYEAISQSMVLYEEQIADSRLQIQILTVIIGTLQSLKNISEANYDPLSTKACQYSSKLLKKPDQCQAAFMCSHLFWARDELKDGNKVLECLQRSLKIVDSCAAVQQINLFVLILNEYLYYFNANNDKVTVKYLSVLMALIDTHSVSKSADDTKPEAHLAPVQTFYQNSVKHIEYKQQEGQPDCERWQGIALNVSGTLP